MPIFSVPTQVLYVGAHENEPITQTLYHADGSIFDGTGYTPTMALRWEYETTNALTASGSDVAFVGNPSLGVISWTPADGVLTPLALGAYFIQWIMTAGGRTLHFPGGRVEVRAAY